MPSKDALQISGRIERWLDRALDKSELLKCEELNLNYHTFAVLAYVDGLIKKNAPRDFSIVYHAIMNGVLRGAWRRHDLIYLTGRLVIVYDRMHSFVGDGFGQKELESIIFMAEDCSDKEIEAALQVARIKGVRHVNYVRSVIENNRRAASAATRERKTKKFIPDEYVKRGPDGVPRVDIIREEWRKRLTDTKEKIKLARAELNARSQKREP